MTDTVAPTTETRAPDREPVEPVTRDPQISDELLEQGRVGLLIKVLFASDRRHSSTPLLLGN